MAESGDGARSIEITATTPDGVSTPLLWIKDYRPEWRSPYFLASAGRRCQRGTRLAMTTYFDTTEAPSTQARAETRL